VPVVKQLEVGEAVLAQRRGREARRGEAAQDVVPPAVLALRVDLVALSSCLSSGGPLAPATCIRMPEAPTDGEECAAPYLYVSLLALRAAVAGLGVRSALPVHLRTLWRGSRRLNRVVCHGVDGGRRPSAAHRMNTMLATLSGRGSALVVGGQN
jgi:hypothetical protein